MPQNNPTLRQIADPIATRVMLAYRQNLTAYAARRVLAPVAINTPEGKYRKLDRNFFFSDGLLRRAPGDTFSKSGYNVEATPFVTKQWGLEHAIPTEHDAASVLPLSLHQLAGEFLASRSANRHEREFAQKFMANNGAWANSSSPTDWDDSGGLPITNVQTAITTIEGATGTRPNSILMAGRVYDALLNNPEILARMQYTVTRTQENVAALIGSILGVDNVYVSRASYNSAPDGLPPVITPIFPDSALVFYHNPTAGEFGLTAMKEFYWPGGGGQGDVTVYWDQASRSYVHQHAEQWHMELIAPDLGYLFYGIID